MHRNVSLFLFFKIFVFCKLDAMYVFCELDVVTSVSALVFACVSGKQKYLTK